MDCENSQLEKVVNRDNSATVFVLQLTTEVDSEIERGGHISLDLFDGEGPAKSAWSYDI